MAPGSKPTDGLSDQRKTELLNRLRRAEGQVRGLQKLLADDADCTKIAQQLLATRRALDSTYVRFSLSAAEQALAQPDADAERIGEVIDKLQQRLGQSG